MTFTFHIPGCHSLKSKRSRIKPILARLHKEFNISVIESDHHDIWQSCQLSIACVSQEGQHARQTLEGLLSFFESHWPDLPVTDENIEVLI
jgi:uncharacterized protein YlxP (DUF503 family)